MIDRVLLAGSRTFGCAVLELLLDRGVDVDVVTRPDDKLWQRAGGAGPLARRFPAIAAAPGGHDLIICAHSHDFVSRKRRHTARLGGIGYHPSLLPRHRGRSAVEWTIRFGDPIAGGTVYWLDDRVDAGAIAAQDWCHVLPGDTASSLWRRELFPMGLRLLDRVLGDLDADRIVAVPQDERVATFEPHAELPRLARPDLPELPPAGGWTGPTIHTTREHL